MAARMRRKPFYRLEEVCERWGMSTGDIAAFVMAKELIVSIATAGVLIEEGIVDANAAGSPHHVPAGLFMRSGLIDLHGNDAWVVLQRGSHQIEQLPAAPGQYVRLCMSGGMPDPVEVLVQDLIVRHAELERFEGAQSLTPSNEDAPMSAVVVLPSRSRGVQPTHDWEACWIEICRTLYFDGVPENQAALVRRLQDWFQAQGRKVPDESTLKKKVKAVWRVFAPEAERKSA
jgi:hypothetical protein